MRNKIFIVIERTPYENDDLTDILHVFLSEKEAEKAVEHYREKYRQEYGEYSTERYRYMIRDIEEEFKP